MAKKRVPKEDKEEEEEEESEDEEEEEEEGGQTPIIPTSKPSLTEKMLTELTKQIAVQNKKMEAMEKRLPKPEPEDAKVKAEEEAIAKKKLEDDAMLADYKEMLESKYGIKEGVESLEEARIAMKMAKSNKLDLQTLSEKMKGKGDQKGSEQTPVKPKSIYDLTRLNQAIAEQEGR